MFCHCSVKGLKFRHSAENMVSFLREMKCGKQSVIGALVLAVIFSFLGGREELQSLDIGDIYGRCGFNLLVSE